MKTIAPVLVAAAFVLLGSATANAEPITVPHFHGLQLPEGGATAKAPTPQDRIVVYSYTIERQALLAATQALLVRTGWKITARTVSPRGTTRIEVARGQAQLRVAVVGEATKSAVIVARRE